MQVTIVAEIASNWEGNVQKAKKFVLESKKAGANAVKFQISIQTGILLKNLNSDLNK